MPAHNANSPAPPFFSTQVLRARRFYLDLSMQARKRLAVVCGGFEKCAPDYLIHRDHFPYLSLEFVLHGQGRLRLNNRQMQMEPGVVFTYGPGVAQRMSADPRDPPEKYFIDFRGREALRMMTACNLAPGACRRITAPAEIGSILEHIVVDGSRGGPFAGNLCGALLEYLFYRIVTSADPGESTQSPAYATYLKCRVFMESNFLRLQSLRDVASETHVDQAYLCRLFQRYAHQTPHQLLIQLKMNKAAELLHDPQLLIKQVAATVGYADPFHFSRIFKSTFGVSPQTFRRYRC